jgi:glycosyltransferase involved in cell wall biosynthesis
MGLHWASLNDVQAETFRPVHYPDIVPSPIDIIMPVGPGPQPYLEVAVSSVVACTGVEARLIMVLDGRDDRELIEDRYGQVASVHTNRMDRGVAGAMNTGLELSQAPNVAVMHADDVCHVDRLRVERDALDDNPSVVALGALTCDPAEVSIAPSKANRPAAVRVLTTWQLLLENKICDPTLMARRSALLAVGGYRDGLTSMQDYELLLRLATVGEIGMIQQVLLGYRRHPGQFSRRSPKWTEWSAIRDARRSLSRRKFRSVVPGEVAHSADMFRRGGMRLRHRGVRFFES